MSRTTKALLRRVEKPERYYNTKSLVSELQALIAKLPDLASPAPPRPSRPRARTARQLDPEQTERLIAGYRAGATALELGESFGLDRRTAGAILMRNGVPRQRALSTDMWTGRLGVTKRDGHSYESVNNSEWIRRQSYGASESVGYG